MQNLQLEEKLAITKLLSDNFFICITAGVHKIDISRFKYRKQLRMIIPLAIIHTYV